MNPPSSATRRRVAVTLVGLVAAFAVAGIVWEVVDETTQECPNWSDEERAVFAPWFDADGGCLDTEVIWSGGCEDGDDYDYIVVNHDTVDEHWYLTRDGGASRGAGDPSMLAEAINTGWTRRDGATLWIADDDTFALAVDGDRILWYREVQGGGCG
ncbi:MAG: hypothetical protein RIE08_16915 [Acidimicrobiales bacterium]